MISSRTVRRIDFVLLAAAVLLAMILNWGAYAHEPLAIDEHVSFWIADESSPSTLLTRSFQYSATPPLSFAVQRLSMMLLGKHEWTLRLPAAASFVAAIVAVWWCGCRWISPLAGGIAAVLLAAHPAVQPIAVAGRPYSFGLLLCTLALDAVARIGEAPSRIRWAGLIALNLALVQTHYLFSSVWIVEFVWLALAVCVGRLSTRHILLWAFASAMCLVTVSPGLWHVWNFREYLNWTTHRPDLDDLRALTVPIRLAQHPLSWVAAAAPILWQVVSGRHSPRDWLDRDRWKACRNFITTCIVGVALPVAVLWLLGRFWLASLAADRYLVIFVPIVTIALAGLCSMLRGSVAPILSLLVLVLWSGAAERFGKSVAIWNDLGIESHSDQLQQSVSAQWREAGRIIGSRSSEPGFVLVGSGLIEMKLVPVFLDDPIFHDYVSCRLGRMYLPSNLRRVGLPMFWPNDLMSELGGFYRSELSRACRTGSSDDESRATSDSIWLVAATDTDVLADTARRMQLLLEVTGAVEVERWGFRGLELVQYRCRP